MSPKTPRRPRASRQKTPTREERFQLLVDSVVDYAIFALDPEGNVATWNPGAQHIKGYRAEEIIGRNFARFYLPEDVAAGKPEQELQIAAREGRFEGESWRVRKDGSLFWASIVITALHDSTGALKGYGKVTRDLTERKRAEENIRRLNEELTASNADLESFASSVAHDLRAPLRQILGFSQFLVEDYGPRFDDEARRYMAKIQEGAAYMGRLIDDLLNLSRLGRQPLALQTTPLAEIAREARDELQEDASGRNVEWRIGELFEVPCDPGLMKQVFVNLLSNALKYSRPRERAVIEIGWKAIDGERVVFVRDNGVGFDMRYAGKLFGVFQRLHKASEFEGTGVGLAIVDRIVRKHGGRVWAESRPDEGAIFYFSLENKRPI